VASWRAPCSAFIVVLAKAMEREVCERVEHTCARVALLCAVIAALLAIVALIGWTSGELWLSGAGVGFPLMAPNTVVSVLFAAVGVALLAIERASRTVRVLGRIASVASGLVGAVTLAEYALRTDIGFDRHVFMPTACRDLVSCVRPLVNSSFALLLLAFSALTIDAKRSFVRTLSSLLALVVAFNAVTGLAGYVYGVAPLDGVPKYLLRTGLSIHAAIAYVLLSVGILCARPRAGPIAIITSARGGGIIARRFLLAIVLAPLIGLFFMIGQRAGLYSSEMTAALSSITTMVIAVGLIMHSARTVDDVEHRLERAEARHLELVERAARANAHVQALVDQMPAGVVFVNAAGVVTTRNRFMEALSSNGSMDLRTPQDEPLEASSLPLARALRSGETVTEELALRASSDKLVPVIASAAPVRDVRGVTFGAVGTFQDITALKELERMREEWMSVVAHDLRQPLGSLSLSAQMLAETPLPEKAARAVARIAHATSRLERMIGDLSDLSRLEAHRLVLDRHPVDLHSIAKEASESFTGRDASRPVRVTERGTPQSLVADDARVDQILGNLLSNAVKYGSPNTPIDIDIDWGEFEVEISVANEGAGLPPEDAERIFQRFERGSVGRHGRVAGLGLGLYICRGLVEAHGGRISVKSVVGGRTVFCFTLPLATALSERDQVADDQTDDTSPLRIRPYSRHRTGAY